MGESEGNESSSDFRSSSQDTLNKSGERDSSGSRERRRNTPTRGSERRKRSRRDRRSRDKESWDSRERRAQLYGEGEDCVRHEAGRGDSTERGNSHLSERRR